MTGLKKGGGGVGEMLTMTDKGGRGVGEMLTMTDKWGRGVWTHPFLADIICEQPLNANGQQQQQHCIYCFF